MFSPCVYRLPILQIAMTCQVLCHFLSLLSEHNVLCLSNRLVFPDLKCKMQGWNDDGVVSRSRPEKSQIITHPLMFHITSQNVSTHSNWNDSLCFKAHNPACDDFGRFRLSFQPFCAFGLTLLNLWWHNMIWSGRREESHKVSTILTIETIKKWSASWRKQKLFSKKHNQSWKWPKSYKRG